MTLMPELQNTLARTALRADGEQRRIGRRRQIAVATVLGTIGVAGVATAAVTNFWQPAGPELGERTVQIERTSPPAAQLEMLGVLRRPAEPEDRGARSLAALRFSPDRVRTNHVRLVATDDEAGGIAVVPIASSSFKDRLPRTGVQTETRNDPICLILPIDDSGGGTCRTTAEIRAGLAILGTPTRLYGLVPDGVASIDVTVPGETAPVRVGVHDNAFVAKINATRQPQFRWYTSDGTQIDIPAAPPVDPDVTITCADGSAGTPGGRLERDLPCNRTKP
jgi:hypothetical protein